MTPERPLQTIVPQPLTIDAPPLEMSVYGRAAGPEVSFISERLRFIRKYRSLILVFTLIVVALVGLATVKMTPLYRAEARIVINRETDDMLGFKDISASSSSEDPWDFKIALETQVNILQSDSLALAVIHQLDLADNPKFNPRATGQKSKSALPVVRDDDSQVVVRAVVAPDLL